MGGRCTVRVHGHEGCRPAEAAPGLARFRRAYARCANDAVRQRPRDRIEGDRSPQLDGGPVLSKVDVSASGLDAGQPVDLVWSTVVGNRVNCSGTCWSFVSVPLGTATAAADGTFSSRGQVPDGLGGWHVIQLMQDGNVKAQVPYFVKRSVVGISALKLKAGQPFTIHLKGVGWTQLDNTIAVDYDNSYIGYGCGFN